MKYCMYAAIIPFAVFFTFLMSGTLCAQPVNNLVKDVVMPPPNAASLGKYGDIPVSYFTGVPNISIPITTVQEGPLSIGVSLSYHASGIKVAEPASWVGAGWNLNAGGMISRTIQGLPDNNAGTGYYYVGASLVACTTASCQEEDAGQGYIDTEPDIFNFSFGGYQGKFYFDKDQICRFLPQQDLKLTLDTGSSPFDGFTITTPDGTRWIFGKTALPIPRTAHDYQQSTNEPSGQISTWHLLRVETYDQKFFIDLYYADAQYSYKTPASCKQLNTPYGCQSGGQQYYQWLQCSTDQAEDAYHRYIRSNVTGKNIQKIVSSTNIVEFVANTTRQDLDQSYVAGDIRKALDEIKIYTLTGGAINNNYCSKYVFSYGYWQDPSKSTSEAKRLKLNQVQQMSCDGLITTPTHLFTYETGDLPYRLSKEVDHWGFYNGQSGNETKLLNIPPTTFNGSSAGASNRNSSEAHMKRGVLKEITYPTGGKTIFTYEANRLGYSTPATVEKLYLKSCLLTITQCCGLMQNQSSNMSFTAAELLDTKFQIRLWSIPQIPGACTPGPVVSTEVSAYKSDGTPAGSPMSLNLGVSQTYAETQYLNINLLITSPVAGQLYYFKIKSTDGYGALSIKSTTYSNQNQIVGGLRVKEIKNTDAVSASNDIVRKYEYFNESDTMSSARSLEYFPNNTRYAFTTTNGVVFTDDQTVPLGTFGHGYHLGYERVKEIYAGNAIETQGSGSAVYKMFWSFTAPPVTCGSEGAYPFVPPQSNPKVGEILEVSRGSTTINTYVNPSYTASTGIIIKIAPTLGCNNSNQCGPIPESKEYQIYQYLPNRLQSVSFTLDGVNTTTTYEYDLLNRYLAPKAMLMTNSDGKVTKTEYHYPVTLAFQCLRDELLARNIKTIPTSTRTYIDNVLVVADSTRWTNWASGLPGATCNSTNLPYPWEFYRYEMTYDANGNATAGTWVRKGVINERSTGNGLPQKFTQTGWQPEKYEWGAGGLITKRTFNSDDANTYKRFVTQYDYHTGTRLLKKITDIDGQYTDFTYDKLMRLDSVNARKTGVTYNTVTKYTYQYKDVSNPRSYVKSRTVFTAVSGSSLTEKTIWQYMDGLGRPVQTVDQKRSPAQKDVVAALSYDNQGRQDTTYNVFESTLNTGAFVATIPGGTPYTLTQYYSDPLNRTWKTTPPSWYPTIYTYGANIASNVKLNHSTGTWYAANSLSLTTVEDPNGNRNHTFKDKKGRLILSRRTNNAGSLVANTYNLYDNKDRLTTVIPPDALITNTDLIFKYLYDAADNMTTKDLPDAAAMTMKYNTRNLMTLMQDGNLAAQGKWLGTLYDLYGRPYQTGYATGTDPNTFTIATVDKFTETTYDDLVGLQAIYKGKVKQSKSKVLDGGSTFLTTDFTYDAHGRVATTAANNFTGGSDNYTFAYDWADNRLTSTRTHKRLSTDATTTILETATYDHAGRNKDNKHQLNGGANVTLSYLNYNFKDELIEKNLGYTSPTSTLQSLDYAYNPQGWLTAINQASLGGGVTALVACPTNPTAPNPTSSTTPDLNDLFYLELKYDNLFSGMSGTIQKNGNIAQMNWRIRGRERQAYSFTYDFLDRLTAASYYDVNDAGTATASNRFNESLTYADMRGNISTLQRQGGQISGSCWNFAQIDNLTYTYTSGTNKISSITDAASATYKAKGFNPGGGTGSYAYDPNGNMTSDPYKNMTVQYNHLNLPKLMTFTGSPNKTIDILYDAAGMKLRKTVKTGTTTNYTQDYIGGIEYRDGVREAIYHAEGRVKYTTPTTTRYEYTIKDHLGNTRISFTDLNANGVVNVTNNPTTNEILQENHYYPFGLNTDGPWMNDAALDNKYQYNGKEWNDDFGLNWNDYGARWYDASVGRFTSVDPRAEKYTAWSPYNYVLGNPIRNIDPQGDTVRVAVGNEFINYTPGMEYTGDNKFAQGVINSLNTMNTSEAGAEVLGSLVASENNYSFVNVVSTDKNGNPVEGVRFRRGENGGGTIEAGASNDVGTIAHELFHGYQIESGMNPATTAGEVGAYLFQDVVTLQAGVPFGASASTNEYGVKYDAAHNNLLYNGFNDADYISANIFFKFSSKNATGLYNRTKRTISTFPKPPIAKFLPAFK